MADEERSSQTIKVPKTLLKRLKHLCVEKETNQQQVMLTALEEYLDREERKAAKKG